MLFSSPVFLLFFLLYLPAHRITPPRFRLAVVILGSSIFYSYWNPLFLFLPYLLTLMGYYGTRWVAGQNDPIKRRSCLIAMVTALLLPLIGFKYANFLFANTWGRWNGLSAELWKVPLPLGISFITFTLIAYVVDVYRGKFAPEKKISRLLASVFFFPHLIAGPIVRPSQLIPQLSKMERSELSYRTLVGLLIFAVGLFKKLVLSDPIAAAIDPYFAGGLPLDGALATVALLGFTLQIYLDFSGYTDMALGCAHALGVRLPRNFNRPYTATSLVDFWRRWHISLSTWLRDYLYIPLGGSRRGEGRHLFNLLITMLLGGLWHGANWTFVVWGLFHGMGLIIVHSWRRMSAKKTLPRAFSIGLTFSFVSFGWLFFRSPSLPQAVEFIGKLFGEWNLISLTHWVTQNPFPSLAMLAAIILHRWDYHALFRFTARRVPRPFVVVLIALLILLSITLSAGNSSQFIYFEF